MTEHEFAIGEFRYHEGGNKECSECWGGRPSFCECGGLIHSQYYDEDWDNVYLYYKCDKCGSTDTP